MKLELENKIQSPLAPYEITKGLDAKIKFFIENFNRIFLDLRAFLKLIKYTTLCDKRRSKKFIKNDNNSIK